MDKITITSLSSKIPDEAAAYRFMEQMRWPEQPICPHCGSINDHYFLKPTTKAKTAEGVEARKTRTGNLSPRRIWKCKDCRKQFSVTTGTVMHGSKVSLRIWLFVIFEMCANKNGIAAREIERKYGIASRSAWFMTQRIREAMSSDNYGPFTGNVVSDETFIGGQPKNRHFRKDGLSRKFPKKTAVIALIDADKGVVRSQVITDVSAIALRRVLAENVDIPKVTLHTDLWGGYTSVGKQMAAHHTVDHHIGQYTAELTNGTNKAENFFSQLKRSIDGTHHNVSRVHLNRYLAEFDFRYSTCDYSDTARMNMLVGLLGGKRLTYKRVTG